MMAFQQLQRQFLAHLRNPEQQRLPAGFSDEGAAIYVDLLYNKFNDSLSTCFPVTRAVLQETAWRRLLKDFIEEHRCLTPYYRQIPDEFVRYLRNERRKAQDPPFLAELAHFEWTELVLSIAEAETVSAEPLSESELLDKALVFAPVMQLWHYVWPVQRINRNYQPIEPPPVFTHILGFRDRAEQVQFVSLNEATAGLLRSLLEHGSARQKLLVLGRNLTVSELSDLMQFGKDILSDLYRRGAIIGGRSIDLSVEEKSFGLANAMRDE